MPIELCRYVTGTILDHFTHPKQWGPIGGAALEPWAKNAFLPTILGLREATDEEEDAGATGAGVEARGL